MLNSLLKYFKARETIKLHFNHSNLISSQFQAESIFKQMFPEKEFLPKAPSPEEIVFHDGTENGQTEELADEMKEQITAESDLSM